MCKIAVFPHIPEGKEKEVWKLAVALTDPMTARDPDGFGYMALGSKGVFGERWLDPETAWTRIDDHPKALAPFANILEATPEASNAFGTPTERVFSLSLHSRMATCGLGLENVHPFVNESENVALIHNGVISNASRYKMRLSSCDSEAILQELENENVRETFQALHNVVAKLEGWYAVSALTRDSKGHWRLNLFKESRSNLYAAVVTELGIPVFVTDPTHLEEACATIGYTVSGICRVRENVAIAINPKTGAVVEQVELTPVQAFQAPESAWRFNDIDADERTYREYQDYRDDAAQELADDDGPVDAVDFMKDPFSVKVRRGA